MRREFGLDGALIIPGHQTADVTMARVEVDRIMVLEVLAEAG